MVPAMILEKEFTGFTKGEFRDYIGKMLIKIRGLSIF